MIKIVGENRVLEIIVRGKTYIITAGQVAWLMEDTKCGIVESLRTSPKPKLILEPQGPNSVY